MVKQSGTTLLELMITLSVAGISLAIAVPAFTSLNNSSRLSGFANDLISSLHLTRSEAIKRNSRVVMCPSETGTSCAPAGGWHRGWLVFHDPNNNAALDAGETVILARPALPVGLLAKSTDPTAKYISYAPSGGTKQIGGAWQAGTLTLCNESGSVGPGRKVVISSTGRPRTEKTMLASCS